MAMGIKRAMAYGAVAAAGAKAAEMANEPALQIALAAVGGAFSVAAARELQRDKKHKGRRTPSYFWHGFTLNPYAPAVSFTV